MPEPLYIPSNRKMRWAGLMSGSGTNLIENIKYSLRPDAKFEFVYIHTDVKNREACKAPEISDYYHINIGVNDITTFCQERGYEKKTQAPMSVREEYDEIIVKSLESYKVDAIALCGYMSIITKPLLERFGPRIINVHPADLSIRTPDGKPRFTGMHVVKDAILAGQKHLYSTTHIARSKVDEGEILMRSRPVSVILPKNFDEVKSDQELLKELVKEHQDRLKRQGDWQIFPKTLDMISKGRYSINSEHVFVDGMLVPDGFRL